MRKPPAPALCFLGHAPSSRGQWNTTLLGVELTTLLENAEEEICVR
jgi:hypothetical protein